MLRFGEPAAKTMTSHRCSESRSAEPEYGPFSEFGTLDGVVILIGGAGDDVSVHVQDGEVVHVCRPSRGLGPRLAPHLSGAPVGVAGTGRWFRDSSGGWQLRGFVI